ncbi:MAG TPA: ATP-binding protein [Candidatus Polarisedimenticolaceae bacterium]|nr:ATP-binding protein [Candidatus Polarisedimenticolaceae bacterium]
MNRLALRIVTPLVVALVVVFAVTLVFLGRTIRTENLRELRERAQLLADTLAHQAELPLLAGDTEALRTLLEGASRDQDVFRAEVLDARRQALARYAPPHHPTTGALQVDSPVTTSRAAGDGQDAAAFVLDGEAAAPRDTLGTVRLDVSTARTVARSRRLQGQVALGGLGLLLVYLGVGLGVMRVVGRPLRALVTATRRVAGGDLSVRVDVASADEIGELAGAFNRMAADLQVTQVELLEERAELERRVALRTAELERAQETLVHSERMSAVGQLVAGVAHELNNPLTVVLGYTGLLRERLRDPALQPKLEAVQQAAESSRKIVQNLLAFARKQKPEQSAVDVNDVVTRTTALRAYNLRSEGIRLELALDPQLPPTWADPHQLQQVVLNLLVNAEQAMQEAGRGSCIRFATRQAGDAIELRVEDDGPGIPPAIRSRIFEPFFTTKKVGQGTGLGLSICYGIVAEHGGRLRVESEEGRYTRFVIDLPVLRESAGTARATAAAAVTVVQAPRPLRLLVIDDDPSVVEFVEAALAGHAVAVDKALGGRDALAMLSTGRVYDAILSDMRMPDVDGAAVFAYLRAHRPELLPRMMFATGDLANPESTSFLENCGRPVLEKPFSVDALRAAIGRVLETATPS